jgi:putative endopeptidase
MRAMRLVMTTGLTISLISATTALVAAPKDTSKTAKVSTTATRMATPWDKTDLDTSVSACTDFNAYANGGWTKKNPIPAAYSHWGIGNIVSERNRDQLHLILDKAVANKDAAAGSNERKIGDYYASCMDEATIEAQGLKPLQPELDRIAAIQDVPALQAEVAHIQSMGFPMLFGFGAEQDFKNSDQVIAGARQGGLGLPDRDYYLKDDAKSKDIREKYQAYVQKIFELSGDAPEKAASEAQAVMGLETKLAAASLTRVQRRNPDQIYHKMTLQEASALTPTFAWSTYVTALKIPAGSAINVGMPDFFKEVDKDLTAVPLDTWRDYLKFQTISNMSPSLSPKFVNANFDFYSTTLQGVHEQLPRWKRCISATDRALGEALGQEYVKTAFPPEAKRKMIELVSNLGDALRSDIRGLEWMNDATKKQAVSKLEAFSKKIGYPDKWRDYSGLSVDRGPYAQNLMRARAFDRAFDIAHIGKPVDRTEWGMTPPTVNAYYNPSMNEIVFPAGILQPPYFDLNRDDAYNYGAAGSIIGHEMTHGFDDQGSKFDAKGNLVNWWTPGDLENFKKSAECIQQQFEAFTVGDVQTNGKLVSGESIADLAGLKIALAAYEKSIEGKPREVIDGFTPEQRLFIGFAHGWAGNGRAEAERLQATTDPHPLDRFRVNGPLSNMPEFAAAFACKATDAMVRPPDKRCVVW